jgi:uncharacterized protein DUF2849
MALQVYTASLLKEGLVAYLCLDSEGASWTTDLNKATAVEDTNIDELRLAAERSDRENIVVGIYAVTVEKTPTGIVPVENREKIRANGPTITLPRSSSASTTLHAA